MNKHLTLFFLFFAFMQNNSQAQNYHFDRISSARGFSEEKINCILKDQKGFLWFGTNDGLKKYDGYRFITYRNDPKNQNSLSQNQVLALLQDRQGYLWIGTNSGGLNRFDTVSEQFTRYLPQPKNKESLSYPRIRALFEDEKGILWIGTGGGGLNRFDPETQIFRHFKKNPSKPGGISHNRIRVLYGDQQGNLWIGTGGGGLNRLDIETETFTHYKYSRFDKNSLSSNQVNTVFEDETGVLWIGTYHGGLNRFDVKNNTFQRFQHDPQDFQSISSNNVNSIHKDLFGRLWVGTDKGLNRFDQSKQRFSVFNHDPYNSSSISDGQIISLLSDQAGILWVGTATGGINKLGKGQQGFIHFGRNSPGEKRLSNNNVSAFAEDNNKNLWVGTIGGGLNRLNRIHGEFTTYKLIAGKENSLTHNRVRCLLVDRSGMVWIGTDGGGLDRYNPFTDQFEHFKHDPENPKSINHDVVWSLLEDHFGSIWVGTEAGLCRWDPQKEEFQEISDEGMTQDVVWTIYEDHFHRIWIGSEQGGLKRYNRETGEFRHFQPNPTDPESISPNAVLSIYEDRQGVLWVGTWGGGLNRLDPETQRFSHFTEENGLPNDVIYGILGDDAGNLWLSTNDGMARFHAQTNEVTTFDLQDGLQGRAFNAGAYFQNATGEMIFGGVNGFNIFRPENLIKNNLKPPMVVTSMQLFDRVVATDISQHAELEFKHNEDFFSFQFAALDYQSPEANQFAIKMEGVDKQWHQTGESRQANYKLNPGHYRFRVRGSNSEGVWNDRGVAIKITVHPPFWYTWWFIFIEILTGILLIAGVIAYLKSRFKHQKSEALIALDLERKTEELEAARAIQLSMLPKCLPVVSYLDIAVYMQTATEVGGDYYDFFLAEDGNLTAAIGDATGHGLQAGTMVAATKALFLSLAGELEPVNILKKISLSLTSMGFSKMYMGLSIVRFKENTVSCSSAAMPYSLLYRQKTGLVEEVELKGLPLGSYEYPYQQVDLKLESQDVLLLASDGLEEMFNSSNELMGHKRVHSVFKQASKKSSQDVINDLVRAGESWAGGMPQQDDVTFLVIKMK